MLQFHKNTLKNCFCGRKIRREVLENKVLQVLFKSNNFAGFVGIYNGLKQDKFTLTANERFNIDGGYVGIVLWLLRLNKAKWMTWHAREVFQTLTHFL